MYDLYIGHASRIERQFTNAGVLDDLDALTIDVKEEKGGAWLATTAESTFHNLNIIANRVSEGIFYAKITPDSTERLGVYLLYWTATYGTGAGAKTFIAGPDVLMIHDEADIPALSDNYVSLDAVSKAHPALFDIEPIASRILRVGYLASRDVDALLNNRFSAPIKRRSDGTYDQAIIDAATAITIARIIGPKGYREDADGWAARGEGIVDSINKGRRRLAEEITKAELGFQRPQPAASNTSPSVELELYDGNEYSDMYRRTMLIVIDKAGAIGLASCKVSIDAGLTWPIMNLLTNQLWMVPDACYGLTFRFRPLGSNAALALGDSWTIEAMPVETEPTKTTGGIRTGELQL